MSQEQLTIEELRAQRDDLELRLAAASVGAADNLVTLLASDEVGALMDAISNAAEPLDLATRKRVAAWVKMRSDMATLAGLDLARLRGILAANSPAPEGGNNVG